MAGKTSRIFSSSASDAAFGCGTVITGSVGLFLGGSVCLRPQCLHVPEPLSRFVTADLVRVDGRHGCQDCCEAILERRIEVAHPYFLFACSIGLGLGPGRDCPIRNAKGRCC